MQRPVSAPNRSVVIKTRISDLLFNYAEHLHVELAKELKVNLTKDDKNLDLSHLSDKAIVTKITEAAIDSLDPKYSNKKRDDISENLNFLYQKYGTVIYFYSALHNSINLNKFKTVFNLPYPDYKKILQTKRSWSLFTGKGQELVNEIDKLLEVSAELLNLPLRDVHETVETKKREDQAKEFTYRVSQSVRGKSQRGNIESRDSELKKEPIDVPKKSATANPPEPKAVPQHIELPKPKEPTLIEKIKASPEEYRAKLTGDTGTTASDEIIANLSDSEFESLDKSLRRIILSKTTKIERVKTVCIENNKLKLSDGIDENPELIQELVKDPVFDSLDCNDAKTYDVFSLIFTSESKPNAAILAKMLRKGRYDAEVNQACRADKDLAEELVMTLDPTLLSKIGKDVITRVLESEKNKIAIAKKMYAAKCFNEVLNEDPKALVALIGMSTPSICDALLTKHLKWSEEHLQAEEISALAELGEKTQEVIYSNWTLLKKQNKSSYSVPQLNMMLRAIASGNLSGIFDEPEADKLRTSLKQRLQTIIHDASAYRDLFDSVLKPLFLNSKARTVLLDFLSVDTLLEKFLINKDCLDTYFDFADKQSASFVAVMHKLEINSYNVKKLIASSCRREFTHAEIKKLLLLADEDITSYIWTQYISQNKSKYEIIINDPEIIFTNPHFTRQVISLDNMSHYQFFDLLIDPREESKKYVEILLRKQVTSQLSLYVSVIREKIVGHSAQKEIENKLEGIKDPASIKNPSPLLHSTSSRLLVDPMAEYKALTRTLEMSNQNKSFSDHLECATKQPKKGPAPTASDRLIHFLSAYLHKDAGVKEIRPPMPIFKENGEVYPLEHKFPKPAKKPEKLNARIALGQFIITECFKGKQWLHLAVLLHDNTKMISGEINVGFLNVKKGHSVNYLLVTRPLFIRLLTQSDPLTFFEILGCPAINNLSFLREFTDSLNQATRICGKQLKADDIKKSLIRDLIFQFAGDSHDVLRIIQGIISNHTAENQALLFDKEILTWFAGIAHSAATNAKIQKDNQQNEDGQLAVTSLFISALKAKALAVNDVIYNPTYLARFINKGEYLIPFINDPKLALQIFHYFPWCDKVFNTRDLETLKQLACSQTCEVGKPNGIFKTKVVEDAMVVKSQPIVRPDVTKKEERPLPDSHNADSVLTSVAAPNVVKTTKPLPPKPILPVVAKTLDDDLKVEPSTQQGDENVDVTAQSPQETEHSSGSVGKEVDSSSSDTKHDEPIASPSSSAPKPPPVNGPPPPPVKVPPQPPKAPPKPTAKSDSGNNSGKTGTPSGRNLGTPKPKNAVDEMKEKFKNGGGLLSTDPDGFSSTLIRYIRQVLGVTELPQEIRTILIAIRDASKNEKYQQYEDAMENLDDEISKKMIISKKSDDSNIASSAIFKAVAKANDNRSSAKGDKEKIIQMVKSSFVSPATPEKEKQEKDDWEDVPQNKTHFYASPPILTPAPKKEPVKDSIPALSDSTEPKPATPKEEQLLPAPTETSNTSSPVPAAAKSTIVSISSSTGTLFAPSPVPAAAKGPLKVANKKLPSQLEREIELLIGHDGKNALQDLLSDIAAATTGEEYSKAMEALTQSLKQKTDQKLSGMNNVLKRAQEGPLREKEKQVITVVQKYLKMPNTLQLKM